MAKSKKICDFCNVANVLQYRPQEIDRELIQMEISAPDEDGPPPQKIAILRVTYQRELICANCGHKWYETFTTEKQKTV